MNFFNIIILHLDLFVTNFLCQIVDIEQSTVSMLPTKVEIKLRKKEPGSWAKLEIPRQNSSKLEESESNDITAHVDAVDLSDL